MESVYYTARLTGSNNRAPPFNQVDKILPPLTYSELQLEGDYDTGAHSKHGLVKSRGSIWTDVLRPSFVGGRVTCMSDQSYRLLKSLRPLSNEIPGFPVQVFGTESDQTGRLYQWRALPSFDFKDPAVVNHDASVLAWRRWNYPGEACGAHLPPGAFELMRHNPKRDGPIQEAFATPLGTKMDAAPGFMTGFSVRELVLAEDSPAIGEPIFQLGTRIFCTEAFRKAWCDREFTGLAFRRLEATEAERKGEIVRVEGRYNAD